MKGEKAHCGIFIYRGVVLHTAGFFYKVSDRSKCNILSVNLSVYLGAAIGILIYCRFFHLLHFNLKILKIGLLGGMATLLANLAFLAAVRHGKISTSWTISI